MNEELPVLWTPAQQAWLQAMGYTVYHDGQLAAELDAALQLSVAQAAAAEAEADAPARGMGGGPAFDERAGVERTVVERAVAPAPARRDVAVDRAAVAPEVRRGPAPAAVDAAPDAARSGGAAARQPAVRLPDRLQIALLRASGCNPNDPATQALMDSWPLQQLRRDPAAKRALWPVLRALRRQSRG